METEFLVIDIPSLCNVIVGRDWVHMMKGVTSRLHQDIKFVAPKGEETFYGDQIATKQWYLDMVNMKIATKEVQFVEEERKVL